MDFICYLSKYSTLYFEFIVKCGKLKMEDVMNYLVDLENVTKLYGNKVALNNVTLKLVPGKIVGLLGPNGSGKTTMLKTLMRIILQQAGTISICGTPVGYETRKYVSFMPDREFLYETMKVHEAIQYYDEMFDDFDKNKAVDFSNKLGLNINDDIKTLSKGTREKVVLMLTLSRNVPIYLLDEPLGSLDPLIKHQMLSVIKEVSSPNNVILISTHLIKDTEEILDDVVFLKNGCVAAYFPVDTIKSQGKSLEEYYLEVFTNA